MNTKPPVRPKGEALPDAVLKSFAERTAEARRGL